MADQPRCSLICIVTLGVLLVVQGSSHTVGEPSVDTCMKILKGAANEEMDTIADLDQQKSVLLRESSLAGTTTPTKDETSGELDIEYVAHGRLSSICVTDDEVEAVHEVEAAVTQPTGVMTGGRRAEAACEAEAQTARALKAEKQVAELRAQVAELRAQAAKADAAVKTKAVEEKKEQVKALKLRLHQTFIDPYVLLIHTNNCIMCGCIP